MPPSYYLICEFVIAILSFSSITLVESQNPSQILKPWGDKLSYGFSKNRGTWSVHGDTAMFGMSNDKNHVGAAYIFQREESEWKQKQKIFGPNSAELTQFGRYVAVFNDDALISEYSGAIHAFTRDDNDGDWILKQTLTTTFDGINFISIFNKDALIGTKSKTYVFENAGDQWTEKTQLVSGDNSAVNFGKHGVIYEGVAVVAAVSHKTNVDSKVFVFEKKDDGNWNSIPQILLPKNTVNTGYYGNLFGLTISLNSEWMFISAKADAVNGQSSGAIYVYEKQNDGSWIQREQIKGQGKYSYCGTGLSFNDMYVVVRCLNPSMLYLYEHVDGKTVQKRSFTPEHMDANGDIKLYNGEFYVARSDNAASVYQMGDLFPSKAPTKTPSNFPTTNPSAAPTKIPSNFPTKNPSEAPTRNPSAAPTKNPSNFPTKNPSAAPTKIPSNFPTKNPSETPTKNPSEAPTRNPSQAPTPSRRYMMPPTTQWVNWNDAKHICSNDGGRTLATIITQQDEDNAVNMMNYIGIQEAWIGINDRDHEGTFTWIDGTQCSVPSNECIDLWYMNPNNIDDYIELYYPDEFHVRNMSNNADCGALFIDYDGELLYLELNCEAEIMGFLCNGAAANDGVSGGFGDDGVEIINHSKYQYRAYSFESEMLLTSLVSSCTALFISLTVFCLCLKDKMVNMF